MQELSRFRAKVKWIKYIFLSSSICILVFTLVTLYIQKLSIDPDSSPEPVKNKANKLSKEYNLNISQPVFEGISKNLSLYVIRAQNVAKNTSDKYLLDVINGKLVIHDGAITIQSDNGVLDEPKKSLILNNNVKILFNDIIFNSQKIIVDLETQDAKSDNEVKVIFKESKIRANKFNTENSVKILKFEGNVDSNFDLNISK